MSVTVTKFDILGWELIHHEQKWPLIAQRRYSNEALYATVYLFKTENSAITVGCVNNRY